MPRRVRSSPAQVRVVVIRPGRPNSGVLELVYRILASAGSTA
ncbi:MAG TPA: hypothetical protein VD969_01750 [Symbiobacteriaceae bacterium]|nr:hypothetical protein [Symbiobacteriaceae bacterium]